MSGDVVDRQSAAIIDQNIRVGFINSNLEVSVIHCPDFLQKISPPNLEIVLQL
jgi:hypothetical protein